MQTFVTVNFTHLQSFGTKQLNQYESIKIPVQHNCK